MSQKPERHASYDPIIRMASRRYYTGRDKLPSVEELTGYSRAYLYRLRKEGKFPNPIKMQPGRGGAVGWRLSTLQNWMRQREVESEKYWQEQSA